MACRLLMQDIEIGTDSSAAKLRCVFPLGGTFSHNTVNEKRHPTVLRVTKIQRYLVLVSVPQWWSSPVVRSFPVRFRVDDFRGCRRLRLVPQHVNRVAQKLKPTVWDWVPITLFCKGSDGQCFWKIVRARPTSRCKVA